MNFDDLIWESDYNGVELGFSEIEVISVYTIIDEPETFVYVDKNTLEAINVED